MLTGVAVAGGFVLDAVFGDPAWLPHPVVWMGRCISALEKRLRAFLPKTPRGELLGGGIVAAVLPLGTLAVTGTICTLAARLQKDLDCRVFHMDDFFLRPQQRTALKKIVQRA